MRDRNDPRVLLISQWPHVKNGEYELIEKIRHTGYKISVVDFLGFDVDTGACVNSSDLSTEYDFAISFHYFTPKFLNIPTFLWVANPLEFMHLLPEYRDVTFHHLRAYDDYLYNGSNLLKAHIARVVGREWEDTGLVFFASCSRRILDKPPSGAENSTTSGKIFYCGVNWERGLDNVSRAQGLLDILQELQMAEFYGPKDLMGYNPWKGFTSYRGEIPFDGISMSRTMRQYGAVLAVSSPAHIKSRTSSSRVFEGFAAGVPVISDDNAHVRHLFGDLVYYFQGETPRERAESVLAALDHIRSNPAEATARVREAQAKISDQYCFETCLNAALQAVANTPVGRAAGPAIGSSARTTGPTIDVFLLHHAPFAPADEPVPVFRNVKHVLAAAATAVARRNATVRLLYDRSDSFLEPELGVARQGLEWKALTDDQLADWERLRLGEKVAVLARLSNADFTVFLTPSDFPHHDYFVKPLEWLHRHGVAGSPPLYVAGFFMNDLSTKAPAYPPAPLIKYINACSTMYRWTPDSPNEHQTAQLFFSRTLRGVVDFDRLSRFDVLFPIAVLCEAMAKNVPVHRARHILLRTDTGYFCTYQKALSRAGETGYWTQHYELISHHVHELHALYDAYHENADVVALVDGINTAREIAASPPRRQKLPVRHRIRREFRRFFPILRRLMS